MRTELKPLYQNLGDKLRQAREGADMTQARLAEAVGLQRTSITQIEKGVQGAPLHVLYKMCLALRVEIHELLPSCQEAAQLEQTEIQVKERTLAVSPKTAGLLRQMDERLRSIAGQDVESTSSGATNES